MLLSLQEVKMDKKNKKSPSKDKSEGAQSSKPPSDKNSADNKKSKVESKADKKADSTSKSAKSKSPAKPKSANAEKKSDSDVSKEASLNKKKESKEAGKPSDKKASQKKKTGPLSDKVSSQKKKVEQSANKEASQEQKSEQSPKKESEKVTAPPPPKEEVKLSGIYAFKLAMSSLYDEKGKFIPVTFLQVKPLVVSQVKQKEKDGYNSVQVACMPQKNNRCSKAVKTHLSSAGFSEGARYVREIRQESVENIEVGQPVSIHSIQKGDKVKLQSISKGHGFAGVVKRWGFKGGPASHGSKTHRSTGSIGNRTEPARVMPGKKMPGHYGVEKVSLKNVKVIDVISDENLIVVKGPVPGARHSLVFLSKQV